MTFSIPQKRTSHDAEITRSSHVATSSQNETYQSMQDGMQSGFGGTFDQLDRYLDSHQ